MSSLEARRRSRPLPRAKRYRGPRAASARVRGARLIVDLVDGRTLAVPLAMIPGFDALPRWALSRHELVGGGIAIHFPAIDEDVSVENLFRSDIVRPRVLPRVVDR